MNGQPRERHLAEAYERHRDDMRVAACWRSRDDVCLPHFHSSIELVYVHAGELAAVLGGAAHIVRAGELLLVSSYEVHAYHTDTHNDVQVFIIPLAFVPSLQPSLRGHGFTRPVYDAAGDAQVQALVRIMTDGWPGFSEETRKGFSYALLGLLISAVGLTRHRDSAQSGLIRNALRYLQENFQSTLPMRDLAERLGYSKSRLSHCFHEAVGCSPAAYRNALRCRFAAQALLETEQTLLEISLAAGFECMRTFYRVFKQHYGVTPTQYIRARQNTPHAAARPEASGEAR